MPVMRAIDESVMAAISARGEGSGFRLGVAGPGIDPDDPFEPANVEVRCVCQFRHPATVERLIRSPAANGIKTGSVEAVTGDASRSKIANEYGVSRFIRTTSCLSMGAMVRSWKDFPNAHA